MSVENKCYIVNGKKIYDDRSIAAGIVIVRQIDRNSLSCEVSPSELEVLIIKRGKVVPESGKWSIPFGYLNRNETIKECAIRETFEETGLKLEISHVNLRKIDDEWQNKDNQNIHFIYECCLYTAPYLNALPMNRNSTEYQELLNMVYYQIPSLDTFNTKGEVDDIRWIQLKDISNYEWAYDADKIIKDIMRTIIKI